MFHAVINNADHPEYGVATIPFPIPAGEYDHVIEMMEELEIGDPVKEDCLVCEIEGDFPVLKRMENLLINLDELDYLAKRLDSFCDYEAAQFQAMAHKLEIFKMKDFINLTFSCQQAAVITDFSDLESIGKSHYLHLNGGCAPIDEYSQVDGFETALLLIQNGSAEITPYGVVYDNGMEMEQFYDGRTFPLYEYGDTILTISMSDQAQPLGEAEETYLYLPMPESKIERVMLRSGMNTFGDMRLCFIESSMPDSLDAALDMEHENIRDLNHMAKSVMRLNRDDQAKLGAIVGWVKPEYSAEIANLAKNLDLFDFVPDIRTPEEYGKYMIQESGHFEFDENLEDYYNYEQYGLDQMRSESGQFIENGYISYQGLDSIEEIMGGVSSTIRNFEMGGMT